MDAPTYMSLWAALIELIRLLKNNKEDLKMGGRFWEEPGVVGGRQW